MAYTHSKIATYTVGSGGVSSINFLSIPQNYTDLKVVLSGRSSGGGTPQVRMTLNNSSSSIYTYINLYGDGSGTASSTESSISDIFLAIADGTGQTANTFTNQEIYISNYTSSNFKIISGDSVMENSATLSYQNIVSGIFPNSSAITSIGFTMGNNFAQYSTATLYGIKAEV